MPTSDDPRDHYSAKICGIALGVVAFLAAVDVGPSMGPLRALISIALAAFLITVSCIDLASGRLPDGLTLPLGVLGLLHAAAGSNASLLWAVLSAVAGFAGFAALAWVYQRVRHRAGLGLGDAKLMAAAGAWLGMQSLPSVVLWATLSALVYAVVEVTRARATLATRIPFGPFLSLGIWLVWLYGPMDVILSRTIGGL